MSSADSITVVLTSQDARRRPLALWAGLLVIAICEILLFYDVVTTGRGALDTNESISAILSQVPASLLGRAARFVAANITPLAWVGYVLFLEGVLTLQQGRSPVRRRPHHFALLSLASVFIWCVFDWVNFSYIRAWSYLGMPAGFLETAWGYLLAFGTIVPGMLMTGQVLLNLSCFDWATGPAWRMPRWAKWLSLLAGTAMFVWPLLHWDPITNLTLWTSFVFLLDPINLKLGRPSMFRDWQNGWYGRTLAAFAGGLACGLLWEFWNYWALTKWTYHLPFLGSAEQIKYFEMPVIGLIGFIPFGLECWIMWQTFRIPLDGLAEPLPDERSLL